MATLGPNIRRLRIIGAPDKIKNQGSYRLIATDLDSGEEITNITNLELIWHPGAEVIAKVEYYAVDATGQMMGYSRPINETVSIANPEVVLLSEPPPWLPGIEISAKIRYHPKSESQKEQKAEDS